MARALRVLEFAFLVGASCLACASGSDADTPLETAPSDAASTPAGSNGPSVDASGGGPGGASGPDGESGSSSVPEAGSSATDDMSETGPNGSGPESSGSGSSEPDSSAPDSSGPEGAAGEPEPSSEPSTEPGPSSEPSSNEAGPDGDLEPDASSPGPGPSEAAYANVTAVSVTGSAGAYTFAVSVESSDIDCSQYADFWEVITPEGELVYRRILEHSHTDENGTSDADAPGNTFTRTGGPVAVEAADEVLVRAHLNTTGYNGVVMRGSVEAGFEAALDLAPDFAAALEAEPPQPETCLF